MHSYFQYEIFTMTEELYFEPSQRIEMFPSLTLCNQKAFSSGADLTRYDAHLRRLSKFCNDTKDDDDTRTLCRSLKSNSGFFQTEGARKMTQSGHNLTDFVIDCQLLVISGVWLDKTPCENYVQLMLLSSARYFNCYRLDFNNFTFVSRVGLLAGVSLVLHLDNHVSHRLTTHRSRAPVTRYSQLHGIDDIQSMGAILTAHHPSPQSFPFPSLDGTRLAPGFSTGIHLRIRQRERLKSPYGKCVDSASQSYGYFKSCMAQCVSAQIEARCNCIDVNWLERVDSVEHWRFCENVNSRSVSEIRVKRQCATDTANKVVLEGCFGTCLQPCIETNYLHDVTESKWPNPLNLNKFYTKFIAQRSFESKFDSIKSALSCKNDCSTLQSQAKRKIAENFLEVSYHLSDHRYMRMRDVPMTSIADVCSKVGGILNLYSGLTVIVVLEIVELFYRLVHRSVKKCRPRCMSSSQRSDTCQSIADDAAEDGIDSAKYSASYDTDYGLNKRSIKSKSVAKM